VRIRFAFRDPVRRQCSAAELTTRQDAFAGVAEARRGSRGARIIAQRPARRKAESRIGDRDQWIH
jgi:hypothetical protein